jgi:cation:H+ antiporter
MFNTIIFIIAGVILLYKGAEWLVGSSARFAQHLHISRVIIGLTVIAIGTSLPELMASLIGAWQGSSDVVLGNILGSNMANIGLVLAIAVIIKPIKSYIEDIYRDAPWLAFGVVMLLVLALDGSLSRIDGLILLVFSFVFFAYIVSHVRKSRMIEENKLPFQEFQIKARDKMRNIILIIAGLAALVVGAQLLISGALDLATRFNAPEFLIGLTVVALGTSLPELAASTWSAIHGKAEVTLGNVIGSNIANIFLILGIVALVSPISVSSRAIQIDIPILVIYTIILILLIRTRDKITRGEGVLLLLIYLAYIAWQFA